jgi:SAM-dependent methyltransferase
VTDERKRIADTFAAHDTEVREALASGDTRAVKHLYTDLGEALEAAVGDERPPSLSYPETPPVVARLLRGVGAPLADIGCGPAPAASIAVAEAEGTPVIGIDIGEGLVRLARQVATQAGVRFHGVVADAEALPLRTGALAGLVCDDTIEHLPDDRAAAGELARVLQPGGRAVIATPNRRRLDIVVHQGKDLLAGRRRPASAYYAVASHLREYTWSDLERVLAGRLRIAQRATVPWSGGWKRRLASRLTRHWPLRRYGRVVVAVARPVGSKRRSLGWRCRFPMGGR